MTIDIPIIATAFVLGLIILIVIVIIAKVGRFRILDYLLNTRFAIILSA